MSASNPDIKPAPQREEALFQAAAQLTGTERAAFLNGACHGDPALRRRIEALLAAHDAEDSLLAEPPTAKGRAATINLDLADDPAGDAVGLTIGRYKLLEKLGEGGCGVVYVAEQTEPVRRRVALKVIKLGMDTRQVVARFEAERQALAMMDHPNIAKVLDAGTTESPHPASGHPLPSDGRGAGGEGRRYHFAGRPYFVMELVRGIRITDYCDQNNLSTKERLELFIKICHAIQHAHQKGIIHRDIKPSNILVTLHDGVPVPKVIDFGIAKATEGRLTDATVYTQLHQFIGTPAYMSPEQAEMSGLDIDTRSDIYSLGVLLYELLVGKTPLDAKELLTVGLDEMRRTIRETEPMRPSTRLSSMAGEERTTTAKRRGADAPKLITILQGDLDWIVMKCLEKDRTRRYETANALAMDVTRQLNSEPVIARPPSNLYRFQKLVRRNQLAFAAAGAVAGALIAGLIASTVLYLRETKARQAAVLAQTKSKTEAKKSDQVAVFLKDMLKAVGPSVAQGRDTTMLREILDKTAERVGKDLKDQPEIEAELRTVLGSTFGDLGEHARAEEMHREALRLRRSVLGSEHRLVAESLSLVGRELRQQGNLTAAEEALREAVEMNRKLLKQNDRQSADALNNLAVVLYFRGQFAAAQNVQREALETYLRLFGEKEPRLADMLNDMGILLKEGQGDLVGAEKMFRDALRIRRLHSGELHPQNAHILHNLASTLEERGDLGAAESTYRESLALSRRIYGEDHPQVAMSCHDLAVTLLVKGDLIGAEGLINQALELYRKKFGPAHPYVAEALNTLGTLLRRQGKPADAEGMYRQALEMRKKLLGEQHPRVAETLTDLALVLTERGEVLASIQALDEAIFIARKAWTNSPVQLARSLSEVAAVFTRQGNYTQAESLLLQAHEAIQSDRTAASMWRRKTLEKIVQFYESWDAAFPNTGKSTPSAEWRQKLVEFEQAAKADEKKGQQR